jgi:hypothetical protein
MVMSHSLVVGLPLTPPLVVTGVAGSGVVRGASPPGTARTGPVLAFGLGVFGAGVVAAAGEVGVVGGVGRVSAWGIGIVGDSRLSFFSSWANVSGFGVLTVAARAPAATLDSSGAICVSLVGR